MTFPHTPQANAALDMAAEDPPPLGGTALSGNEWRAVRRYALSERLGRVFHIYLLPPMGNR